MENGSYSKEMSIPYPTDSTKELFQGVQHAFFEKIPCKKIYGLGISFGKLSKKQQVQLSLFEDVFQKEKEERFDDVMDKIRETYGRNAIFRCSALLENSTIRQRHMQIGGHRE